MSLIDNNLVLELRDNNINYDRNNQLDDIDPDRNNTINLPTCNYVYPEAITNTLIPSTSFSCLALNVCSLKDKFQNLQLDYITKFRPSVIGLCETKITNDIQKLYNIEGYEMIALNNQSNKGGLALYIKNNFTATIRPQQSVIRDGIETLFADITTPNDGIITVGVVYRRSINIRIRDFSLALDEIITSLNARNKCYIMGDFNIDLLRNNANPDVELFLNTMISKNFYPTIRRPTRVTSNSRTLIDNIFVNRIDHIDKSGVIITDISDHFPLFSVDNRASVPVEAGTIRYRIYSEESHTAFKNALMEVNWVDVVNEDDTNRSYDYFHNIISEIFESKFPLQIKNLRDKTKRKRWVTAGLFQSIRTKRRLYRRYIRNPNDRNRDEYKRHKNLLSRLCRVAREQHYQVILDGSFGDSRQIWQNLNKILGKNHRSGGNSVRINGDVTSQSELIATAFNSYFNSIPTVLSNNITHDNNGRSFEQYLINQTPEADDFPEASLKEITDIINDLKNCKSYGWDNITTEIIKKNCTILAPVILNLINKSLRTGIFPNHLKRAKLSPIFKSKDKLDMKNYRPISVLPIISKIFEKVFYRKLYDHFQQNQLLTQSQFGFRTGAGTEHALLKFVDDVLEYFDENKFTVATFMDLSKAFDCVNHDMLIKKLKHYGVPTSAINWIQSYLSNREHFVVWNQTQSPTLTLNIGVPQGSILGPLLFLIYINDIIHASDNLTFVLYADDTTVYAADKSLENAITTMNAELQKVSAWFDANKLTLNVDKTQVMMLSRKRKITPIGRVTLRGQEIDRVDSAKFLGVIVDQKLNWKTHIALISQKISKSCGIIYRIRRLLNESSKRLLYYNLIYPYIIYCINVWSSTYKTNFQKLFVAQKRAIKALFSLDLLTPSDEIFANHSLLPLQKIINYNAAILAYKVTNNQFFLTNFLPADNTGNRYPLRNILDLQLPRVRTEHSKLFIRYRATHLWNTIPATVRNEVLLKKFKYEYRQILLQPA